MGSFSTTASIPFSLWFLLVHVERSCLDECTDALLVLIAGSLGQVLGNLMGENVQLDDGWLVGL